MKKKSLIGNCPMIKIRFSYCGVEKYLYAKLEYYNYTGSIKDRVVSYILEKANKEKKVQENQILVEATSGNTGISLAALGALFQHPVHIFMPDWVSVERVKIMKLYGATVHLVSKQEGGFLEAIRRANSFAEEKNGYCLHQFSNQDNLNAHYATTGKEIVDSLSETAGIVSGIGTGGTLMGIAKRMKEKFPKARVIALEPKQLPVLTKGTMEGSHKIEGIGDEFVPELVDLSLIDQVVSIDEMDAICMAKKLASEFGLGVGISSGANFLATAIQPENGYVTIFADDFKKYLSTDLMADISMKDSFFTNKIELIDFEVVE